MYYKVMTGILLFPWSMLVVMIVGYLCDRRIRKQ